MQAAATCQQQDDLGACQSKYKLKADNRTGLPAVICMYGLCEFKTKTGKARAVLGTFTKSQGSFLQGKQMQNAALGVRAGLHRNKCESSVTKHTSRKQRLISTEYIQYAHRCGALTGKSSTVSSLRSREGTSCKKYHQAHRAARPTLTCIA